MKCIFCGYQRTKILETRFLSRDHPQWIKRRRQCLTAVTCGRKFWTVELPIEDLDTWAPSQTVSK